MINDWSRSFRQWRRNRRRSRIAPGNAEELQRLASQGTGILFLSSFPKSGNTWLRMILSDILTLQSGNEIPDNLAVHAENIIPDIYYHPVANRASFVDDHSELTKTAGVIVKTHEPLEQTDLWFADARLAERAKHLCLFRCAQDALVSYFHHSVRQNSKKKRTRHGIDHFCLDHVARWKGCLSGYVDLAERAPDRAHLVSYERMLEGPLPLVAGCLDWVPLKIPESVVQTAIENRNFRRLQSKERSRKPENTSRGFFRTGTRGSGTKELAPGTWDRIEEQTTELYHRALAVVERQTRASGRPDREQAA